MASGELLEESERSLRCSLRCGTGTPPPVAYEQRVVKTQCEIVDGDQARGLDG